MIRFTIVLLSLAVSLATSAKCVNGVNNIIKFSDTMKGKGKIEFQDFEIATFDEDGEPACYRGKPQFRLPGKFQLVKGFINVKEPIAANSDVNLELTVEKDSMLIGKVCNKGKSANAFVPDQLCNFLLCEITPQLCSLLSVKTSSPVDVLPFVGSEPMDMGAFPIPQLGGNWKISARILANKRPMAGVQLGNGYDWLNIDSDESQGGFNIEKTAAQIMNNMHEEL